MRTIKNLFGSVLVCASLAATALLSIAPSAEAQDARYYTLKSGGTNVLAADSTNTLGVISCSEYDTVGFQLSVKATGAATSILTVNGYDSIDASGTLETLPSRTFFVALNGTTLVVTNVNWSVPSEASITVKVINTNAAVTVTNVGSGYRLKAHKVIAKPPA